MLFPSPVCVLLCVCVCVCVCDVHTLATLLTRQRGNTRRAIASVKGYKEEPVLTQMLFPPLESAGLHFG